MIVLIDTVWSVVAVVGVGVAVWALVDSYIDRRVLRRDPQYSRWGPREAIVHMNIRGAGASLFLHSFFVFLGILALTTPEPPRATPALVGLATGYITVALTNVSAIALNQIDRLRLRR